MVCPLEVAKLQQLRLIFLGLKRVNGVSYPRAVQRAGCAPQTVYPAQVYCRSCVSKSSVRRRIRYDEHARRSVSVSRGVQQRFRKQYSCFRSMQYAIANRVYVKRSNCGVGRRSCLYRIHAHPNPSFPSHRSLCFSDSPTCYLSRST